MSKLPRNLKAKELIIILERLDFVVAGKRGSHIRFTHSDGRWTQVAVHPKPIPQGTLRAIMRQIDISLEEFLGLLKKN